MFAIIEIGNKQFRVEPETIIETEKTGKNPGDKFTVEKVLFVDKDGQIEVGKPYVSAKVEAEVLADTKAKKIDGFIYKKRKRYQKHWGHRQPLQKVKITKIA